MGRACNTSGGEKSKFKVLMGKTRGRDNLEDLDINGRIILRWNFRKWDGVHGLD